MRAETITRYTLCEAKVKPRKINRTRTEQLGDSLVCKVWVGMFAAFALGTCLAAMFMDWK